jgi:hypothetical protein
MKLDRLIELGFDRSYDAGKGVNKVKCSQCEVMIINGTPTHESGCHNQTRECEECDARIPKHHRLCESCANPEQFEDEDSVN